MAQHPRAVFAVNPIGVLGGIGAVAGATGSNGVAGQLGWTGSDGSQSGTQLGELSQPGAVEMMNCSHSWLPEGFWLMNERPSGNTR